MPGAVEILPPSPALRASKLPDARIRDHAIRVAPLLDNFHVTWLEKEKDRWVQEGWITKAHKDALVTGVGFSTYSTILPTVFRVPSVDVC